MEDPSAKWKGGGPARVFFSKYVRLRGLLAALAALVAVTFTLARILAPYSPAIALAVRLSCLLVSLGAVAVLLFGGDSEHAQRQYREAKGRRGLLNDRFQPGKVPPNVDVVVIGSGMSGLTCAGVLVG